MSVAGDDGSAGGEARVIHVTIAAEIQMEMASLMNRKWFIGRHGNHWRYLLSSVIELKLDCLEVIDCNEDLL